MNPAFFPATILRKRRETPQSWHVEVVFAAGSGIAPIRAVIRQILRNRYQHGTVILYDGARNPDEFAYSDEFPLWVKGGIKIRQTVSNKNTTEWKNDFGYVQHMLDENP